MVMPRKGTRRIVVEGRAYRWSARLHGADANYQVTVEREGGGGQRLACGIWAAEMEAGGIGRGPRAADLVRPDIVRRMILTALVHGWKPDEPGLPPMRLDDVSAWGRSTLVVDGHTYGWTAVESADGRGVTVWISPEAAGGQRLESTFDCGGTGSRAPGAEAVALVTPSMVRRVVVAGLAAGWTPDRRGLTPFRLESETIAGVSVEG
jgi:hypothetical protein